MTDASTQLASEWEWAAGAVGAPEYEVFARSRVEAINEGRKLVNPGEQFQIIEAISSNDPKYEGSDFVPFVQTRNHQVFTRGVDDQ